MVAVFSRWGKVASAQTASDSGAIHDFPNFVTHVVSHYTLAIVSGILENLSGF